MGKGGNATPVAFVAKKQNSNDEATKKTTNLESERKEKMNRSPEFYWADGDSMEEPHVKRRKEIIAAHPEIKKLFGPDTNTKNYVLASLILQLTALHLLQGASWYTWLFVTYTLSGTINHSLTLAMHEAAHGLCDKGRVNNRILGIFANLTMGIPASASFRRYHLEHHKYQGEDLVDVDIPHPSEASFFSNSTPMKIIWCFLQPAFYSLRPLFTNPKEPGKWEFINITAVIIFDLTIGYFFGVAGVCYLVFGTLLGMGIHPVAGHFISEHYVMNKGQETYSYYGPLNWFTYHVGYHNEHHDFPFVSGKNLRKVRQIAPEFYDTLPHYHSWIKVIWDYIMDELISPFSRVKRVTLTEEDIHELKVREAR
jgi:sphingolipid delta-4 desaturase